MSGGKVTKFFPAVLLLCVLLIHTNIVNAKRYNVGDAEGWGFSVAGWPNGKTFRAGDRLVFKYPSPFHNVVVVDKNGYDNCNPTGGKVYSSGNDRIQLVKGTNYFICGVPGHCGTGMKITVTAT